MHNYDHHHPHISHGGDGHDHSHDDEAPNEQELGAMLAALGETVALVSVGIDIGSATSQVIFSRIELERAGQAFSSRYLVTRREQLYASPVMYTPYTPRSLVDAAPLGDMVRKAFAESGLERDAIDTGVVLLTGEAARRDNAESIAQSLAAEIGSFVCAAAGHELEGALAAHGSGSVALAAETDSFVLNVDIGGGTTKFTLAGPEGIVWSSAVHVGGRLAAFDSNGVITRLESQGTELARRCGIEWTIGATASEAEIETVGSHMASLLGGFLPGSGRLATEAGGDLLTTFPGFGSPVGQVIVSGGVSTFVDRVASGWREDLGAALGAAFWRQLDQLGLVGVTRRADRQATVIGAAENTVALSGSTIHRSVADVHLPLRNLRVVTPAVDLSGEVDSDTVRRGIEGRATEIELARLTGGSILALHWQGAPEFTRLSALAEGIASAAEQLLLAGEPLCVVLDADIGRLLGRIIESKAAPTRPILVLDGIDLPQFNHIDVGAVLEPAGAVPVVVKSFLFG